jgi:hypothetical protein
VRLRNRAGLRTASVFLIVHAATLPIGAQAPTPVARVTFQEAIEQAQKNNPTVVAAAAAILRRDRAFQVRPANRGRPTEDVVTLVAERAPR